MLIRIAATALLLGVQPSLPQPNVVLKKGDVEVQAVGCIASTTLTETNLNRGSSSDGLNPTRQWRLRVTKEQRAQLKNLEGHQLEVSGTANAAEIKSARLTKSAEVGKGRIYVGTEAARSPQAAAASPPTLAVTAIRVRAERCP
jgi:hypothetical protein